MNIYCDLEEIIPKGVRKGYVDLRGDGVSFNVVEVEVRSATTMTYTEDTWELEIWTNATATTSVGGVEFQSDFDPAIFTVIDSDAQASGI